MQFLGALLVLIVATSAPTRLATATRIDGNTQQGELRAWEADHIVLAVAEGDVRLGSNEMMSLRWPKVSDAGSDERTDLRIVELVDGTVLPVNDLNIAESQMELALPALAGGSEQRLVVPVARALAVQMRTLDAPLDAQWQEIRNEEFASDVLVILKKNGQSLDYVEGVLGDVTAEKIEFTLDGDSARVDRDKVAGFVYRRQAPISRAEARCVLEGHSGLIAPAARVQLAGDTLQVATVSGLKFDWPLADIHFADFSAGKVVYLSDIRQATVKRMPLVGLPPGADLLHKYGQPRRDQSAFGGPMAVAYDPTSRTAPTVTPTSFGKGLALRSRTEIAFRLPSGYRNFMATVGIEPATRGTGSVQLAVFGDDRLLHDGEITGQQPPLDLNLDVTRVKRLKIIVDFGKNLDSGDWLNLCDARLVK